MILPPLSPAQVLMLAHYHIAHYAQMAGGRNVREDERLHYLGIWKGIRAKRGLDLAPFEQTEVLEAIESGDFDTMLGIRHNEARP